MDLSDEPNKGEIWSEYERSLIITSHIISYKSALFSIKYGEKNNTSNDIYTIADELRENLELDWNFFSYPLFWGVFFIVVYKNCYK